jgi:SAM-dependent methyltransferase
MNTKIYAHLVEKIEEAFSLPRYSHLHGKISADTVLDSLPWTPSRQHKLQQQLSETFDLDVNLAQGTVRSLVDHIDQRYLTRFFGEIWKPRTEDYTYSGWNLVDQINAQNPQKVLDYGCGYNQYSGRIKNLVGIDPYNNCADYMVDILEFGVEPQSFDHIIVFGSLNFNSREDIELRFNRLVELLMPRGRMYFRVNPGIPHANGPWVDIFPWNFEIAYEFSQKNNLDLTTFKKDRNDRFYFEYIKLGDSV